MSKTTVNVKTIKGCKYIKQEKQYTLPKDKVYAVVELVIEKVQGYYEVHKKKGGTSTLKEWLYMCGLNLDDLPESLKQLESKGV